MEINIGKSIKRLRKNRAMTQEQLAEALGVTVGAVYKWENELSIPELTKLVELADLLEVSVDYLLDYRVERSGVDEAVEKICNLRFERKLEESAREAEKALQKYPNNFKIVIHSAQTYILMMRKEERFALRCIELLERACILFEQNQDIEITLKDIHQAIANCYIGLKQYDKTVELLKKLNADGSQSDMIGLVLAEYCKKPDEAMPYLSEGLYENLISVLRSVMGFSAAYMQLGRADESIAVVNWMIGMLKGLHNSDTISFLDKLEAVLLVLLAASALRLGDHDSARSYLVDAFNQALKFDSAPEYRPSVGLRFYHGQASDVSIDDLGDTAMLAIEDSLAQINSEELKQIWEEIKDEKA